MCREETMMRLSKIEDELLDMMERQTVRGLESVDARELGEVVDMVKDVAEAKYYCSIVLAMQEEEEGPMGYNSRRYANGRYAPKGRGSMGYEPMGDVWMDDRWEGPMGYSGGAQGGTHGNSGNMGARMQTPPQNGSQGSMGYGGNQMRNGYGDAYNRYQNAKMGYNMAKTAENRRGMDDAANEHVREFTDSMTEMWQDADQSQRNQMRNALVKFVNELK